MSLVILAVFLFLAFLGVTLLAVGAAGLALTLLAVRTR